MYKNIETPAVALAPANTRRHPPDSLLARVKHIAQRQFENSRGSHDWEHTLRVCRLCEHIGAAEGVDMDVLRIAAYLHDIGRGHQDASHGEVCHAEKGARLAEPIIRELPLSPTQKDNILHCIRSHRFRSDIAPRTPEA
ncbi:MAG: HD domain-containing protein, partial [Desulfobacterales bacterium]